MDDVKQSDRGDILVVDDSPANLRLLSQALGDSGYQVRVATSGPRALASARAARPELILLDIRMPEMDGFAVCQQLKADEQTREVPIIFISALDEIEDKVRAFRSGAVDYITKPFEVDEVLARTHTHLTLRRLQAQLEAVNQRFHRELWLAGLVQASFLPHEMPEVAGWQLASCLRPARETSGDFFDIIRLAGGRLGLVVADVVDKGVPAALLMAMSWSLLNTFAAEHPDEPEAIFRAINERLLLHLDGQQFVTAWYGMLNTADGRFVYANAGHPPPLLVSAGDAETRKLVSTGPPLGVAEDSRWQTGSVTMAPGDSLVLYTDGIIEAQGTAKRRGGDFFGQERLLQAARAEAGRPAPLICQAIVSQVEAFMSGAPQSDDMALLVVTRERCDSPLVCEPDGVPGTAASLRQPGRHRRDQCPPQHPVMQSKLPSGSKGRESPI